MSYLVRRRTRIGSSGHGSKTVRLQNPRPECGSVANGRKTFIDARALKLPKSHRANVIECDSCRRSLGFIDCGRYRKCGSRPPPDDCLILRWYRGRSEGTDRRDTDACAREQNLSGVEPHPRLKTYRTRGLRLQVPSVLIQVANRE